MMMWCSTMLHIANDQWTIKIGIRVGKSTTSSSQSSTWWNSTYFCSATSMSHELNMHYHLTHLFLYSRLSSCATQSLTYSDLVFVDFTDPIFYHYQSVSPSTSASISWWTRFKLSVLLLKTIEETVTKLTIYLIPNLPQCCTISGICCY